MFARSPRRPDACRDQRFLQTFVEGGACRLVSRNRNAFKTFEPLAQAIGQELSGRSAILDGEIVRPGPDGRPMFYAI